MLVAMLVVWSAVRSVVMLAAWASGLGPNQE